MRSVVGRRPRPLSPAIRSRSDPPLAQSAIDRLESMVFGALDRCYVGAALSRPLGEFIRGTMSQPATVPFGLRRVPVDATGLLWISEKLCPTK